MFGLTFASYCGSRLILSLNELKAKEAIQKPKYREDFYDYHYIANIFLINYLNAIVLIVVQHLEKKVYFLGINVISNNS